MSVVEAWNGPGRRDGELTVVRPSDNGVHLPSRGKPFEHWYFDATFDNGYSVVVFFNKRRPEDMPWARPWVEITLYAPDGSRQQFSKRYSRSKATFTADRADVTIGGNRAHIESVSAPLPSYLVHAAVAVVIQPGPIGFDDQASPVAWRQERLRLRLPGAEGAAGGGVDAHGPHQPLAVAVFDGRRGGRVDLGQPLAEGGLTVLQLVGLDSIAHR